MISNVQHIYYSKYNFIEYIYTLKIFAIKNVDAILMPRFSELTIYGSKGPKRDNQNRLR
jgi:hypothetical protein